MLRLAGEGSAIQRREAVLYCQKHNINVEEFRDLARRVTAGHAKR
jgi:hypothetical protein